MQNVEDKPWENEELKKLEDALPRLKTCDLENVSGTYKAKTGVGCDGFHPKVPLDEIVEFLEKGEQSGKGPQQACTTMFFLIPKNVKSVLGQHLKEPFSGCATYNNYGYSLS